MKEKKSRENHNKKSQSVIPFSPLSFPLQGYPLLIHHFLDFRLNSLEIIIFLFKSHVISPS